MPIALCWDIDGTLLTTGEAGLLAWEDALSGLAGGPRSLEGFRTAGLTDVEIARILVGERLGRRDGGNGPADSAGRRTGPGSPAAADPVGSAHPARPVGSAKAANPAGPANPPEPAADLASLAERLLRRYEALLPDRLPLRRGRVMPGVVEILEAARQRGDVLLMLLTGNTRAGARSKLSYYGLLEHFECGAFADGSWIGRDGDRHVELAGVADDRPTIARRARELALARVPELPSERLFVVGDTPHDIDCGRAIGARTVAVASGGYGLDELAAHDPWLLLETLPDPEAFFERLQLGESRFR